MTDLKQGIKEAEIEDTIGLDDLKAEFYCYTETDVKSSIALAIASLFFRNPS